MDAGPDEGGIGRAESGAEGEEIGDGGGGREGGAGKAAVDEAAGMAAEEEAGRGKEEVGAAGGVGLMGREGTGEEPAAGWAVPWAELGGGGAYALKQRLRTLAADRERG